MGLGLRLPGGYKCPFQTISVLLGFCVFSSSLHGYDLKACKLPWTDLKKQVIKKKEHLIVTNTNHVMETTFSLTPVILTSNFTHLKMETFEASEHYSCPSLCLHWLMQVFEHVIYCKKKNQIKKNPHEHHYALSSDWSIRLKHWSHGFKSLHNSRIIELGKILSKICKMRIVLYWLLSHWFCKEGF